jgi:iron complex outermembrane receptor protein
VNRLQRATQTPPPALQTGELARPIDGHSAPVCRPPRLAVLLLALALAASPFASRAAEPDAADEQAAAEASEADGGAEAAGESSGGTTSRGRGVEVITVTAQKREESVQDVPISMTALSGQMLEDRGLTDFQKLQDVAPNVRIQSTESSRSTSVRIRGIGSIGFNAGIDPSVGVFIDGVYQSRAAQAAGDLVDIDRVEILRGPQGTLYGKNTAAGAINVHTRRPSYDYQAFLEGRYGTFDLLDGRGWVNVPVVDDRVATRISGYRQVRDGLDRNLFDGDRVNDSDKWGLRSKTLFDISDTMDLIVIGDYSLEDNTCCIADIKDYTALNTLPFAIAKPFPGFGVMPGDGDFEDLGNFQGPPLAAFDPTPDGFDNRVHANVPIENRTENWGMSGTFRWEIADHALESISAYRELSFDGEFDGDFSLYDGILSVNRTDLWQVSEELRLVSPSSDTLEYVVGFYFHHQSQDTLSRLTLTQPLADFVNSFLPAAIFPANTGITDNRHESFSYAGFGQATLHVTDQVSLTGGLRLSYEEKTREGDFTTSPPFPFSAGPFGPDYSLDQDRDTTNLSGTAIARWFPMEDVMLYASYARGFKSGGFNADRETIDPTAPIRDDLGEFDDEQSDSFEGGFKSRWFDGQLTLNGTFFYTIYKDFQAFSFDGTSFLVTNADELTSYGVEAEALLAPTAGLLLGSNMGFNITEFEDFENALCTDAQNAAFPFIPGVGCTQDLSGERLDNAPRWSFSTFGMYEHAFFEPRAGPRQQALAGRLSPGRSARRNSHVGSATRALALGRERDRRGLQRGRLRHPRDRRPGRDQRRAPHLGRNGASQLLRRASLAKRVLTTSGTRRGRGAPPAPGGSPRAGRPKQSPGSAGSGAWIGPEAVRTGRLSRCPASKPSTASRSTRLPRSSSRSSSTTRECTNGIRAIASS